MIDRDFGDVVDAFASSVAYRAGRNLIDRVSSAAADAALLRPIRRAHAWWCALAQPGRIAFASITVAWCALLLIIVREMLPRYATSGLPWWWNVTVAAFAAAVAAVADRIAAAWPHSAPARVWRRLVA